MSRTQGDPGVVIGLVDGPVALDHPGLRSGAVLTRDPAVQTREPRPPSRHGTAVAGVLAAEPGSGAPAVCPGCSVVAVPALRGTDSSATPSDLADAIGVCLEAGVTLINLSIASLGYFPEHHSLSAALDALARRGIVLVAAAGNGGLVAGTPLTRHPAVLPVASCSRGGTPLQGTNLAASIGRRGLMAPGEPIPSLDVDGGLAPFGGTSLAAALVTGALALAASLRPGTPVGVLRRRLTEGSRRDRRSVVPPVLDARAALLPELVSA